MVPLPRARPDSCDASIAVLVPEGDTVARKGDPVSVVRAWSQGLGFEGLSYFAPARDPSQGAMTLWSTWGDRWDIAYRLRRHADVDPRIVATRHRTLPCLWEGGSIVAHGRLARFLREAGDRGIRSGVAIPLGASAPCAIVAFDASEATLSPARRSAILARLGDLLWVAHAVHASRHATAPVSTPAPCGLSQREHACLAMSARGLTSRDIATKLGIATRTVDFHIGNVLQKLAASNRHEAIAKAIAQGLIAR
jgi:LuxR family quorum-sensing system transcriptional regulator SolR